MDWTPQYISEILSLEKHGKKRVQSETVRASPHKLLAALAITLNSEVYELSFPYLFMHRTNWTLLTAFKKIWDPILRESFGPDYIQQEWQLPFAIGQVLALTDGVDGLKDDEGLTFAGLSLDAANTTHVGSVCMHQMYRLCGRDYDVPQEKLDMLK